MAEIKISKTISAFTNISILRVETDEWIANRMFDNLTTRNSTENVIGPFLTLL
jgi:hypothetical protein